MKVPGRVREDPAAQTFRLQAAGPVGSALPAILVISGLLSSIVAACSAASSPTVAGTSGPSRGTLSDRTLPPETPRSTTPLGGLRTPTPTPPGFPQSPSWTPEGLGPIWHVQAVRIEHPLDSIAWQKDGTLLLEEFNHPGTVAEVQGTELIYREVEPTPTRLPLQDRANYSPDGEFVVGCEAGVSLTYLPQGRLIAQADIDMVPLKFGGCEVDVDWAPDSSAVALVGVSGEVFVWQTDGGAPVRVAAANPAQSPGSAYVYPTDGPVAWAPDSKRLMIVQSFDRTTRKATVMIIDPGGRPLLGSPLSFTICLDCSYPLWFTDGVFAVDQPYMRTYYRASDGVQLFKWAGSRSSNIDFQPDSLSPDGRWLAKDHVGPNQDLFTIGPIEYTVHDLHTGAQFILAATSLSYLGWSEDSSALYLLNLPEEEGARSAPDMAFGLLAFHPFTHKIETLFAQAMQVEFAPDDLSAFVAFPAREEGGEIGLSAGIWKLGTSDLIGRQRLTDEVRYRDPEYGYWIPPNHIQAAWSHDGTRVVFANHQGQLKLLDLSGEEALLADQLYENYWVEDVALSWAPDDRWILAFDVYEEAWLVRVPES